MGTRGSWNAYFGHKYKWFNYNNTHRIKNRKAGVSRQDLSNTIVGALALYLLTSGFTNDFIQNNVLNNPSLINKLIDTSQKVEYKAMRRYCGYGVRKPKTINKYLWLN